MPHVHNRDGHFLATLSALLLSLLKGKTDCPICRVLGLVKLGQQLQLSRGMTPVIASL